ncbi:hypothetical protein B0H17DRAFT_1268306, partial [Mycena rosella]
MKRSEGVDHLNMVSWTGHNIAGDCHTISAWDDGSKIAQQIFAKLHFPPDSYNYPVLFSDLEIDMLRPFGDGKYPGVESDTDRSMIVPNSRSTTSAVPTSANLHHPLYDDDDIENQGDGISFEDSLDEIPELALPTGRGVDPNDYLNVEGKWVHKQRICRVVINADFEPKSTERLKRVRGHTK